MVRLSGLLGALVLALPVATAAAPATSKCVPDGAPMTATGVVRLHHSHDRATGKTYSYVMLEAPSAVGCRAARSLDAVRYVAVELLGAVLVHKHHGALPQGLVRKSSPQGAIRSTMALPGRRRRRGQAWVGP